MVVVLWTGIASAGEEQRLPVDLLVVGDEYLDADLPRNPEGIWWVLHQPAAGTALESLNIRVTRFSDLCGDGQAKQQRGRSVSVPDAENAILLLRGAVGLSTGSVRTAFLTDGVSGGADSVTTRWNDDSVVVRHLVESYRYNVEMTVGSRTLPLHSDEWQGDGQWMVRWIGDLNRDGWPDVLLDASHKYSVYTTRLFLSAAGKDGVEMFEAATLTHSSC